MKKIQIIIVLILATSFSIYAQEENHKDSHEAVKEHSESGAEVDDSHAHFDQHSISTGIGTAISTELETLGINGRAYYNLNHRICFGPEFSYFKKGETELLDFNLVAHYIFETKIVGFYPLIGLNYTIEKEELEITNDEDTVTAFGLKVGVGAHRNFGNLTVFLEYSRVQSELADNFIATGVFYTFKY